MDMIKFKKPKYDITKLFDFTIAGYTKPNMQSTKPYYTRVLHGKKNAYGKVYLMSPKDFLLNSYAITDIMNEEIRNPNADLSNPTKPRWALPWVDIARKKGFGRGRALVCHHFKIKAIPVLMVGWGEEQIKEWLKEKKISAKAYKG